jgi:hypothetical protein
MCVALKIKNKLQFINESLPKPKDDDDTFGAWDRCNSLVIAWITQTLGPSISESVIWLDTTKEMLLGLQQFKENCITFITENKVLLIILLAWRNCD